MRWKVRWSSSSSKHKNGHQQSDHLCKQSRRQGTPGLILCTRLLEIKWQHQGLSFHQFPLTLFIPNFIAKLRRLGFQDSYWSNSPFLTTLCGSQLSTQNMFGLLIHPNFFRNWSYESRNHHQQPPCSPYSSPSRNRRRDRSRGSGTQVTPSKSATSVTNVWPEDINHTSKFLRIRSLI